MGRPVIDLRGRVFGLLTVQERDMSKPQGNGKEAYWLCRCACGRTTSVRSTHLTRDDIRSCGCREGRISHGMRDTPEYRTWLAMRQRCNNPPNPAYQRYGGRGITVDPAWNDFAVFFAYVGKRPSAAHSLERIDNARGYEPGNVTWATPQAQARNTRRNYLITHDGRTQPLIAWAEETGIHWSTIRDRIARGWPVSDALKVPPSPHNKKMFQKQKHLA
jgi:hypothetical protein